MPKGCMQKMGLFGYFFLQYGGWVFSFPKFLLIEIYSMYILLQVSHRHTSDGWRCGSQIVLLAAVSVSNPPPPPSSKYRCLAHTNTDVQDTQIQRPAGQGPQIRFAHSHTILVQGRTKYHLLLRLFRNHLSF